MIAENVGFMTACGAGMGIGVYWKSESVLENDSETLGDDREAENMRRNSVEECPCHWQGQEEEPSGGSMILRRLEIFD